MLSKADNITGLLDHVIKQLESADYEKVMDALISLGRYYEAYEKKNNRNKRSKSQNAEEKQLAIANWLTKEGVDLSISKKLTSKQSLNLHVLMQAWFDDALVRSDIRSQRYLASKVGLNRSTRRQLTSGLYILGHYSKATLQQANESELIKTLDKKAVNAIKHYKTTRQKVLQGIAYVITGFVALTAGVTTAAAFLMLPLTWPIFVLAPIAVVLGLTGVYSNWKVFNKPVYQFFNDILGKDYPFEGMVNFIADSGKKNKLNKDRRAALGASLVLSASVGLATAALTYTSVVGLSSLAFLAGVSAFMPPVAIVLAAVAFVGLTALMISSFNTMLKTENVFDVIRKSLKSVEDLFEKDGDELTAKKVVTYAVTGFLVLAGLVGLIAFSIVSGQSIAVFLADKFHAIPAIAAVVGYTVGAAIAGIAQIPFILESTAKSVANVYSKGLSIFKKPVSTGAAIINAVGNGILVVPGLLKTVGVFIATSLGATGFVMSATAVFGSDDTLSDSDKALKKDAKNTRRIASITGVIKDSVEAGAGDKGSTDNKPLLADDRDDRKGRGAKHYSHVYNLFFKAENDGGPPDGPKGAANLYVANTANGLSRRPGKGDS